MKRYGVIINGFMSINEEKIDYVNWVRSRLNFQKFMLEGPRICVLGQWLREYACQ